MRRIVPIVLLAVNAGCASRAGVWGADVVTPVAPRVGQAAVDAVRSPETWAPVAAALLLTINDADVRISRWASDRTPVFGSRRAAGDASDDLRLATGIAYLVTALAAPSGDSFGEVLANKASGLAVGLGAHGFTTGLVHGLKSATDRPRPNRSDDRSFPSGHAASASVRATLAARNAGAIDIPETPRRIVRTACAAAALGCAWARVEANVHYPTDVLAGLALGHFFGAFVNDAFMSSRATASIGREGLSVGVSVDLDGP